MSTTTGDPSTLKTPSTLSGGDLVSRLLAATPPYLYNVPLTPHSFFFSEMLRSFVQAKAEASAVGSGPPPPPRRRKRSWRDARDSRDRPLELTTKERPHEKYFHVDSHSEHKSKHLSIQHIPSLNFENKTSTFGDGNAKGSEDGKSEFCKHKNYFDERQPYAPSQSGSQVFSNEQKVKPEELPSEQELHSVEDAAKSSGESGFLSDPKNKLEFPLRNFPPNFPTRADALANPKNFGMPTETPNPDFIPAPMWYPPYPMPQSYPGIDPLHFFIDLRVSGHIWDRKLADRQPPFKSKHTSAFNVPQSKEYNRPLNLTRDEASSSRTKDQNSKGTHYILKNLTKTYKGIRGNDKTPEGSRNSKSDEETDAGEASGRSRNEDSSSSENKDEDKKDIRALIGLELVVDYVKEPKDVSRGGKNSPQMSE